MLALILFAVDEEDVDESAASAVEDMEVLTTLDKVVVAAETAAAALRAACILFCLFLIDLHRKKAGWRSFIRHILQSMRIEPGVSDLFFNAR